MELLTRSIGGVKKKKNSPFEVTHPHTTKPLLSPILFFASSTRSKFRFGISDFDRTSHTHTKLCVCVIKTIWAEFCRDEGEKDRSLSFVPFRNFFFCFFEVFHPLFIYQCASYFEVGWISAWCDCLPNIAWEGKGNTNTRE